MLVLVAFHYHCNIVSRSCWLLKCLFCCPAWSVSLVCWLLEFKSLTESLYPVNRLIPSVSDLKFNSQHTKLGDRTDISATNKTCWWCYNNNKMPTGTNITNWMGRWWSLKIKVISILILTEIFPLVLETWYLKTLQTLKERKQSSQWQYSKIEYK